MKKNKPNIPKNGKWHQGQFNPVNKQKYKGSFPIIYRSSWELQFMRFCDKTPNVLQWGSESLVVLYQDATRNNSQHRYFVDFNMIVKQQDGTLQKFYIEVKPFNQTHAPKKGKKISKSYNNQVITFVRNVCKWKAAQKVAKSKGGAFKILTEQGMIDVNF